MTCQTQTRCDGCRAVLTVDGQPDREDWAHLMSIPRILSRRKMFEPPELSMDFCPICVQQSCR